LLLYPTVSDYWNSFHQSRAIASYAEAVSNVDNAAYDEMMEEARRYNQRLYRDGRSWDMSDEEREEYQKVLDVTGTGIMGYIEIQKINCFLPIYHGTSDSVLQIAIGHIEGSSLPVGGANTHSVLSGHRGLPSAKLFSDLDQIREGDTFVIRVLDEMLTYEVDQIRIVLPHELQDLELQDGKDLCTLVTCTPYGINTHRMLVRGHRIANEEEARQIRVTGDALKINPDIVAPIVMVPMILILLILMTIDQSVRKYLRKRREAETAALVQEAEAAAQRRQQERDREDQ
jgi:sortase A